MRKLSKVKPELLPEFQRFLLERKLVAEKNIRFFAYRVSRFLEFSRKHDYPTSEYQLRNMSNAPQSPLDALYKEQKS